MTVDICYCDLMFRFFFPLILSQRSFPALTGINLNLASNIQRSAQVYNIFV